MRSWKALLYKRRMEEKMGEAKSPVIELPEDPAVVAKLRRKLDEYKSRLRDREPHEHPDLYTERMMDARCKIAVLERLLRDGRVVTWDLALELGREFSQSDTPVLVGLAFTRAFPNACGVVADYCKTGGANARGGTGLK